MNTLLSKMLLSLSLAASVAAALFLVSCATAHGKSPASKPGHSATSAGQRALPGTGFSLRHTTTSQRAPVVVRWVEKERSGRRLVLVGQLEYAVPLEIPLDVAVDTPHGVTLVSGEPAFRTAPGPTAELTPDARDYVFDVAPDAAGDIVLSVSFRSASAGLFARDSYPVGTPASAPMGTSTLQAALAEAPQPPQAPALELTGTDLGAPTRLAAE